MQLYNMFVNMLEVNMMASIKWKHFPRYWPFVRGIHRSPVNSLHKRQRRGTLIFSLICALNKQLSKQSWGWWFEAPSYPLWRHCKSDHCWCAILIMEAPVSIFQESPLPGAPRERLFHIHSIHRYQLCAKYLYPSTLLWQMNGCNP